MRVAMSEDMLILAVRYALGRSTYVVSEVVIQVIQVLSELSERCSPRSVPSAVLNLRLR